jgi:hypothetical protein
MEQDRASFVLLYQYELEGTTADDLRDRRQPHRRHHDSQRARGEAFLDEHTYEKGQKISDDQFEQLNVKKHSIHPDWNYTSSPGKKRVSFALIL